ncbi:MAG: hypothetical protein J7L04_10605, partial [Bacteroidales bacterium]|nr:hypothetical protein [Bacteroidales bacterium]
EEKIAAGNFIIPDLFKKNEFISSLYKIKLIKGRLGLENGFPQWASYFENAGNFKLIVLPVESDENTIYIAEIEFGINSAMVTFLNNFKLDPEAILNSPVMIKEKKMYLQSTGDKKIILLESPDDFDLLENYIKIVSDSIDN